MKLRRISINGPRGLFECKDGSTIYRCEWAFARLTKYLSGCVMLVLIALSGI